jgi:hypothetical protein
MCAIPCGRDASSPHGVSLALSVWELTKVGFLQHDTDPSAWLPLPPGEGRGEGGVGTKPTPESPVGAGGLRVVYSQGEHVRSPDYHALG